MIINVQNRFLLCKILRLNGNLLVTISHGLFDKVPILGHLDISSNLIEYLEGDWSHLILLKEINLSENRLTTLRSKNLRTFITGKGKCQVIVELVSTSS